MLDAHARAVDHPHIATVILLNRIHDPVPGARLGPSPGTIVACRVQVVALRPVAPKRARAQDPEDVKSQEAVHPERG